MIVPTLHADIRIRTEIFILTECGHFLSLTLVGYVLKKPFLNWSVMHSWLSACDILSNGIFIFPQKPILRILR